MKNTQEYTIWNSVTPIAITSTTDATPIVVTATSHGLATGDRVMIYGHTTNVAANGYYTITYVSANTFSLQDRDTGTSIAGSGAGAGGATGRMVVAPKIINVKDFRNAVVSLITAGTATLTVGFAASNGKLIEDTTSNRNDTPNFAGTLSDTNPYSFVQVVNLEDATAIDGGTGVAVAGTDINKNYEVNINGLKYLTLVPTAWTAGAITAKIMLFDNL